MAQILGFLAACAATGLAQPAPTNQVAVVEGSTRTSIEALPPFMAPTTNPPPYFIRQRATFDGVLPKLRRARNPLQLVNPFAPASHGSGWDNVAVNPATGRAEGVAVFAIRF